MTKQAKEARRRLAAQEQLGHTLALRRLYGNELSRAAAVVLQHWNGLTLSEEDARLFHAPSECLGIIYRGAERRTREQLVAINPTFCDLALLCDLMEARTSYKWVYQHAVGSIFGSTYAERAGR